LYIQPFMLRCLLSILNFFWQYWGLNRGLTLARQVLCHLSHSSSPLFLIFFMACNIKKMFNFVKGLFCIFWDDHMIFLSWFYFSATLIDLLYGTILAFLKGNQFDHGVWSF
jgi:hypothetical protein